MDILSDIIYKPLWKDIQKTTRGGHVWSASSFAGYC